MLGCFYSHISTRIFRRALTASLDSCAEIKGGHFSGVSVFSGVTKSGRVWRKVPESGARSVSPLHRRDTDCTSNDACKHETHPPRVKQRAVLIQMIVVLFVLV